MQVAGWIVALVAVVTLGSGLSRRVALPAPLVMTLVGLGVSFIPGLPGVTLSPEVVLVGFLPPLLYAAALRTPSSTSGATFGQSPCCRSAWCW